MSASEPSPTSAEVVVPGSHNPAPAAWPPSAVTPQPSIDAPSIAEATVAALNAALAARDFSAAADLFLPDGLASSHGETPVGASDAPFPYWRDHLMLSWQLRTLKGREGIRKFLEHVSFLSREGSGALHFAVDSSTDFRAPKVADFRPLGGAVGVIAFITAESAVGTGRGVVRLVEIEKGVWKIWTLYTALEKVKGWEEQTGPRRELGVRHGHVPGRIAWTEKRKEESEFVLAHPEVLIVGAGQSGLTAAARLKRLGISVLVIDKFDAVGDNWRNRYQHLVLHDPVWYDHLPYLEFPSTWPIYTPKDKIADWFQLYAKAMDLDIWTRTQIDVLSYNDTAKNWHVRVRRVLPDDGEVKKEFVTIHIIMATGHSGRPKMPSIPGMDSFQGDLLCHSGDFLGAKDDARGKKAVVIGACNSALDISQDYAEKGYDVTVIQRSSTHVISSESTREVSLGGLYGEGCPPVEDADLAVWSFPSEVLKALQVDVTSIAAERDRDMLDGLQRAGFRLDNGPSGGGLFMKYLQRGGGYYINVGAAQLIIDGKIKVKSGQAVAQILPRGIRLADGTELEADEVVFATGYESMRSTAKEILGDALPDDVGDVWGWDEEGEMRGIWRETSHPGVWIHGGNLAFTRYYSRPLALQILAKLRRVE
ncbi:hypothetical protein VTJ49DRAFT_3526 [Mycothermus thermophilus]|uniref:Flavin-containing monooxygenase n=1 Tax=Humicola insolens TaxID=85995 RepID=A0ABR3V8D6_HUMIN